MACALTLLRLNSLFVMIQNLGATRVDSSGSSALDATMNDNSTEDDFTDHPPNDGDDESGSHCRCISGIEAIVEEHASLRGEFISIPVRAIRLTSCFGHRVGSQVGAHVSALFGGFLAWVPRGEFRVLLPRGGR